jgi:hypothetical protein
MRPVFNRLLERLGLRVGEVESDPRLDVVAEQIDDSLTRWCEAVRDHSQLHAQGKSVPVRRIK